MQSIFVDHGCYRCLKAINMELLAKTMTKIKFKICNQMSIK